MDVQTWSDSRTRATGRHGLLPSSRLADPPLFRPLLGCRPGGEGNAPAPGRAGAPDKPMEVKR